MDYLRVEANPPNPNIKLEASAHEVGVAGSALKGILSLINI